MTDIEIVPAGSNPVSCRPGDMLFLDRGGLVSRVIKLGERLRSGDTRYSHVAVVVHDNYVVEALTMGVERDPISKYKDVEYALVHTRLDPLDQAQAVGFAVSCVGYKYGWTEILGIVLRYLTPGRGLWFGMNGTEICSGLAAQAQVRGWANYYTNPSSITPAELIAYYERN